MNLRTLIVALTFPLWLAGCGDDDGDGGANDNSADPDAGTSANIPIDDDLGTFDAAAAGFFGSEIPVHHGYYEGRRVSYWLFGPAPREILPIYVFPAVAGQRNVIPPAFAEYSPWWRVHIVQISDDIEYAANDLKTEASILRAQADGLLSVTPMGVVVNCPIVQANATLQDDPQNRPVVQGWTEGLEFSYFQFEALELATEVVEYPVSDIHVLIDVVDGNGTPRFEGLVGADLNGDGDTTDTNNVVATVPGDAGYSPLWSVNKRELPGTYPAVAQTLSNGPSDVSTVASDIVSDDAAARLVRLLEVDPNPVNCPIATDADGVAVLSP